MADAMLYSHCKIGTTHYYIKKSRGKYLLRAEEQSCGTWECVALLRVTMNPIANSFYMFIWCRMPVADYMF